MTVTSLAASGLLTVSEAAEHARLSESKMRALVRNGEVRGRRIGRCVRILRTDLEEWERALPTMGERAS